MDDGKAQWLKFCFRCARTETKKPTAYTEIKTKKIKIIIKATSPAVPKFGNLMVMITMSVYYDKQGPLQTSVLTAKLTITPLTPISSLPILLQILPETTRIMESII